MDDIGPKTWRGEKIAPADDAKRDNFTPPYKEVYHAVRRAYGAEVGEVWGRQPTADCFGYGTEKDVPRLQAKFRMPVRFAGLKRERVRSADYSPYDWIIQGAWTMQMMRRILPRNLMACLDAKHIYAIPPDERRKHEPAYWGEARLYNVQLSRKRAACHRLADLIAKAETYGRPDRAYTLDRVLGWAGLSAKVDDEWAAIVGKDVRTLRRWR